MRLQTKLGLFAAAVTVGILALFVWLLPYLMQQIAFKNTNKTLLQQRGKVLSAIKKNGIDFYLDGDSVYGSYSMLKDEYISLEPYRQEAISARLQTDRRVIEKDTISYRILSDTFTVGRQPYLLEIGKKVTSITEEDIALQKATSYILILLAILIIFIQLFYTRYLLSPLDYIVRTRLTKNTFPFKAPEHPLQTSTNDFKFLDASISALMEQVNHAFEKEKEFTSNASHELMTPISIMQSKVENMLTTDDLPDHVVTKLEDTMRIMKRLKKIVNSLLLISRIENEQYEFNDNIPVKRMVREVIEELQHRVNEKELIINEGLSNTRILQYVNKDLLFQLFYNLIHNAIKFSKPRGSITIKDYVDDETYYIAITDTGVGMNPDQIEKIFDRFKKGLYQREGFGLGLSIVKSIAGYLGITITVVSSPNKGAVFTLQFSQKHVKE
ncbi:sensor histidine kinase [Niabella soli]|uniref:histidine kinase n=1 Tax=Niabella soli DSM 19437 TaxID=929713 RepID=W0EWW2_9BACT|nr:HAMP domain-containing sensor histidine kinase [Niabella soli]AHF15257.1 histidine kinase [Niabella soli DSM 19437]